MHRPAHKLGCSILSTCLVASVAAQPGTAAVSRAPAPFPIAHGLSYNLQRYSGLNWLANATLSGAASAAASVKLHGRVHVRVRGYSFTDALHGKFKSVDVTARGGKFRGVPFGNVHLSTNNPFVLNYFRHHGSKRGLANPLVVMVAGDIDQSKLSQAFKSPAVTDGLRFLKFELPGLGAQRLQVLKPQVELIDDHVRVDSFLVTQGAAPDTGIKVRVTARPVLDAERYIRLQDMNVESKDIQDTKDFGPFLEQLFNPLIDFGRYDRLTHAFRLTNLDVANKKVQYAGRLLLVPKPDATAPGVPPPH